ncbi:MAG: radical SAM family heme chaperone HemW [Ktedonobacterales bacterium]
MTRTTLSMQPMQSRATADGEPAPYAVPVSTCERPEELQSTISLYLHIPFCLAKCHYCDFNSYAGMLGQRERYVSALNEEISVAGRRCRQLDGTPRRCRTIFFGGGTPSLLTAAQVETILQTVRAAFAVDPDAEVTLEANPGALEYGHLQEIHAAGVNRLSMGAQSFDAGLLHWMGRIHTPAEIESAFGAGRAAGFDNINLDFIYALPGQSVDIWRDTLRHALELGPAHLSLYSLIVEEGTPLYSWVQQGRVCPADDDTAADMYELAEELLGETGYQHYEISNWAGQGYACSHNLTYWRNLPYVGLGAGAHGWYASHRYSEARPIGEYIARVRAEMGKAVESETTGLPAAAIVEDEAISPILEMSETAFVGMRLSEGIDRDAFARRFGRDFDSVFGGRLAAVRAAGLLDDTGSHVRLSKRGRLLGNEVFECLLPAQTT